MYTLSFGSKLRYHGLIFESRFFFFLFLYVRRKGARGKKDVGVPGDFMSLGEFVFSSFIFNFLRAEVERFLVSHFRFSCWFFFTIIYISSSSSLFDIIRFFFGFWLAGWIRLKGNQSIAR